jgi:ABC-type uncharacterized transport system permease subunit
MAYISTTGKKEMIEYNVLEKNGSVYHNEYGAVQTDDNIININLVSQLNGDVEMNVALDSSLTALTSVDITIVKTLINK